MKKTVASGLIGLAALGGGVAIAAPGASAQEAPDTERNTERQEARAERKAQKVETLTSALGISAEDLQTAKDNGQNISDIAASQGVDLQSVIDALLANAQARIDAKVESGRIDADQAADRAASIEERITARVNGEEVERDGEGRRGSHGKRGNRGNARAEAGPAA